MTLGMTASEKKEKLLEIARKGEDRPTHRKSELGSYLTRYTKVKSSSYDEKFTAEIKALAPNWFVDKNKLRVINNKKFLLELACKKQPKPTYRNKGWGKRLSDYTDRYSGKYDEEFAIIIEKFAPDWLETDTDRAKKLLIDMASRGEQRPKIKIRGLGRQFFRFTNKKSSVFDRKFHEKIKSLRPDWLKKESENKKELLIRMALNKEPRPKRPTKLGHCLNSYIYPSSSCYDDAFKIKIKILAPHWFIKK